MSFFAYVEMHISAEDANYLGHPGCIHRKMCSGYVNKILRGTSSILPFPLLYPLPHLSTTTSPLSTSLKVSRPFSSMPVSFIWSNHIIVSCMPLRKRGVLVVFICFCHHESLDRFLENTGALPVLSANPVKTPKKINL